MAVVAVVAVVEGPAAPGKYFRGVLASYLVTHSIFGHSASLDLRMFDTHVEILPMTAVYVSSFPN